MFETSKQDRRGLAREPAETLVGAGRSLTMSRKGLKQACRSLRVFPTLPGDGGIFQGSCRLGTRGSTTSRRRCGSADVHDSLPC